VAASQGCGEAAPRVRAPRRQPAPRLGFGQRVEEDVQAEGAGAHHEAHQEHHHPAVPEALQRLRVQPLAVHLAVLRHVVDGLNLGRLLLVAVDVHLRHLLDALAQLARRLHRVRVAQLRDGRLEEARQVIQRRLAAIPAAGARAAAGRGRLGGLIQKGVIICVVKVAVPIARGRHGRHRAPRGLPRAAQPRPTTRGGNCAFCGRPVSRYSRSSEHAQPNDACCGARAPGDAAAMINKS
jgi:hypothetical protein